MTLAPRRPWEMTAVVSATQGPGTLEAFWLDPNELASGDTGTRLAGVRAQWSPDASTALGIAWSRSSSSARRRPVAPFFAWFAPSRMHVQPHLKPASRHLASDISSEFDIFGGGRMEHDGHVGPLLKPLDDLKVADDTIAVHTTDNGAIASWRPDGGATRFRGERPTTWEGATRVPLLVRWPARIPKGSISNGICHDEGGLTAVRIGPCKTHMNFPRRQGGGSLRKR